MSLDLIPKGVLDKLKRISYNFLWYRGMDKRITPLLKWKRFTIPKEMGGCGLKNIFNFVYSLSTKNI
jgi:hypothetical protein